MEQETVRPILAVATNCGMIRVEVHVDRAPKTAAYVLDLVKQGAYDGSTFYRSTALHRDRKPLIQGGPWSDFILGVADAGPKLPTTNDFETTDQSGSKHVAGAVSLARDLMQTGRALPEWFVCLDDYPDLDFDGPTEPDNRGFPVFGTVIEGLDVVETIAAGATGAPTPVERLADEVLIEPVTITSITVVDSSSL